jgi:hypothetical protein
MKHFTFRLPVKKYIQKYLTTLYGETIQANMDTDIGFVVLNTLASRIEGKVSRGYNKQFENINLGQITFIVPFHYYYLTKKELSVHTSILLNRYFENRFEEDFVRYIQLVDLGGWGKYKKAIEGFAKLYNIEMEEDISFDGLKKMEYRQRKKNLEISLRRLSPIADMFSHSVA